MSNSNALTNIGQGDSTLAAFGVSEDDALKPSRLDLLQPIQVADEPGLTAGRFRDAKSNLQSEKLNIVPLLIQNGRVLFPPGGELGAKPVCRSMDGIMPVSDENIVRQDGGLGCAKCPKARWKKINGRNIRSECQDTITVLFAELETQLVYRFKGKGTAIAPMKDFKETIAKAFRTAKFKGEFLPPYGMIFELSSVKIKGTKGTFFIPKFTFTGRVNPDDVPHFGAIHERFAASHVEEEVESEPVAKAMEGEYVDSPSGYEEA
jgi:hypothetical protein